MRPRSAAAAVVARLQVTRAFRAWKRYSDARGNVLAAGVGYFAFFSIFPATALAFSVFGFFLQSHPELLAKLGEQLNQNLPGFVKDAGHPGIISLEAPAASALTITGVVALVTLVLSGMGWLGAVRDGIRAVFGLTGSAGGLVSTKLRDLGVLVTLGLGIATFAVLSSGVGVGAGWVAERLGMPGQELFVHVAGFAVTLLADTGLMMLLLRVVSGVFIPWRALVPGALVGGVGFSLLKLSAGTLLPRVTANPLFASLAIVVGLLFWLNMIARLTLVSAAWVANDVEKAYGATFENAVQELRRGRSERRASKGTRERAIGKLKQAGPISRSGKLPKVGEAEQGLTMTSSTESVSGSTSLPTFSRRSGDRTTLGAGIILGVMAVATTVVLRRGIRLLVGQSRH